MEQFEILGADPAALAAFGQIAQPLLDWYQRAARDLPWRRDVSPYRTWVSEIMLQQTRVEAVRAYFERFTKALPTVASLAKIPEPELMKLWEGLGYYSRARNLQKAAKIIVEEYCGALPASYASLLGLPGFGEYTAGAVASIAFGIPKPAVDGNVLRVASRLLASFADTSSPAVKAAYRNLIESILPESAPGAFNQSLMELGALVCLPNTSPRCEACPVRALCAARENGCWAGLPVKAAKKERRVEQRTIAIIAADEKTLLFRREKGLLHGMFEPLNLEGHLSKPEIEAQITALGGKPEKILPLGTASHIFTHIHWQMKGFYIKTSAFKADGGHWADKTALAEKYAVPSAFRAFFERAEGLYKT